jgi:hypothetical protein
MRLISMRTDWSRSAIGHTTCSPCQANKEPNQGTKLFFIRCATDQLHRSSTKCIAHVLIETHNNHIGGTVHSTDCFDKFIIPEEIETYQCEQCAAPRHAKRYTLISKPPAVWMGREMFFFSCSFFLLSLLLSRCALAINTDSLSLSLSLTSTTPVTTVEQVLIVVLKRFCWNASTRAKIDTVVNFPLTGLNLSNYIKDNPNVRYNAKSIVAHHGNGYVPRHRSISSCLQPPVSCLPLTLSQFSFRAGHYTAVTYNDPSSMNQPTNQPLFQTNPPLDCDT